MTSLESFGLFILPEEFTICKLKDFSRIDIDRPFMFAGSTDEEKSLVCPTKLVPSGPLERSDGWRAFRIEGILEFSLVGILAEISGILSAKGIGIFTISTFNTDYFLVRGDRLNDATQALALSGYTIK